MTFVCDQCSNAARFAKACNESTPGILYRYPKALYDTKDPQMLPTVLSGSRTLITVDYNIAEEHADFIPAQNTGIIVVRLRRSAKTMTERLMKALVARFKDHYPNWRYIELHNIHLEICEDCVMVTSLPLGHNKEIVHYTGEFARLLNNAVARFRPNVPSLSEHDDWQDL